MHIRIPPYVLRPLVMLGAGLPLVAALLFALGRLLAAMGDRDGARLSDGTAIVVMVAWVADLVWLLLALGANAIEPPAVGDSRPPSDAVAP